MYNKLTIEEMQEIAESRGGKCLSKEYVNNATKLKWQCSEGHEWGAIPDSVKRGTWCLICAGKARGTIEEMQKLAESRGGKCLSSEYINSVTNLEWQCNEGHIWKARPSNVIHHGSWCPKCSKKIGASKRKNSIEYMQELAGRKGGKCLSTKYINNKTKLKWQCKEGHTWETKPNAVVCGQWCPFCAGIIKLTIDYMHKLASEKGGKCLSSEYINNRTELKWQCKEGHEWKTAPANIVSGRWCPICSTGLNERICRKFFEVIFNEKFPTKRPKWLVNKNGGRMELDGYNERLKMAFEYQGRQHYDYIEFFHRASKILEKRVQDDALKKRLCERKGVFLIEVPHNVTIEEMEAFIVEACESNNISIPEFSSPIDYKNFDVYSPQLIKEMQEIAKSRGGKCLSKNYIGTYTNLKWQCKEGHIWEANPNNIKNGTWCLTCAGKARGTIEEMQELANNEGGKCLSKKYVNRFTKLKWQCKEGHVWETPPGNIIEGTWCPHCARNIRLTIDDMQKLASKKGGRCLSTKYRNRHAKLKWQCKEGHIWETAPAGIQRGRWCPTCARKRR